MFGKSRSVHTRLASVVALALLTGELAAAASPIGAERPTQVDPSVETVSADPLPTVQVDGVVWDQVIVGDRVYVAGEFSRARPAGAAPGQDEVSRTNLLAYQIDSGELVDSWAPAPNAQALTIAASSDGAVVFVAGDFTEVNGVERRKVAAIDAHTGEVLAGWNPEVWGRVRSIARGGDTLFLGGEFTVVDNQQRERLAAVDVATGDLLDWQASADRTVFSVAAADDLGRVFAAGSFGLINGQQELGVAALDADTGARLPWSFPAELRNGGESASANLGLRVDDDLLLGVGWDYGGAHDIGFLEGTFAVDAASGNLRWTNACLGDQYDVAVQGEAVYTVGHEHDCGMVGHHAETTPRSSKPAQAMDRRGSPGGRYNAYGPTTRWEHAAGLPATEMLHWEPRFTPGTYTGKKQAGWTVEATDDYVLVAGEFTHVNGVGQQGLVRFARRDLAPNQVGPERFDQLEPTVDVLGGNTVRVSWITAHDADDRVLTYELLRGPSEASSEVLGTWTVGSDRWDRRKMAFIDVTASPGNNRYRVRVSDPYGNGGSSGSTDVDAPPDGGTASAYRDRVLGLGAVNLWRLGGSNSADAGADWASADDLTLHWSAQLEAEGALLTETETETDTAVSWPESTNTSAVRGTSGWWQLAPQDFSIELWFKTTTQRGGKIVGFGNSRTGRSSSNTTDRHVYMSDDGRLHFGLRPDWADRQVVSTTDAYNDGEWHHVVATLGTAGAQLYVDAELVASDASITQGQVYTGYWRIAGDRLTGWPMAPSREAFGGTLDEVAVYPTQLGPEDVRENYAASGRPIETDPPDDTTLAADSFERDVNDGWGDADVGGTWRTRRPDSQYQVTDGVGTIVGDAPGVSRAAYLDDVSATNVDITASINLDEAPTGGGAYVSLHTQISNGTYYRPFLIFRPGGDVRAYLRRVGPQTTTDLAVETIDDLTYTPGEWLDLRVLIHDGALKLKVWPSGEPEPAWSVEATDPDPLSDPGAIGIVYYISSQATDVPISVSVDDLVVAEP